MAESEILQVAQLPRHERMAIAMLSGHVGYLGNHPDEPVRPGIREILGPLDDDAALRVIAFVAAVAVEGVHARRRLPILRGLRVDWDYAYRIAQRLAHTFAWEPPGDQKERLLAIEAGLLERSPLPDPDPRWLRKPPQSRPRRIVRRVGRTG